MRDVLLMSAKEIPATDYIAESYFQKVHSLVEVVVTQQIDDCRALLSWRPDMA